MPDPGPPPPPVVAVAGPCSVDMTLREPPSNWSNRTAKDHYTPDMLQRLEYPPELGLGGNGAAAAYVLGTLGVRVLLNGPTGNDPAGALVRQWLADAHVECVAAPGPSTMFAITPVDATARRLACLLHPTPTIDWGLSANHSPATWLLIAAHSQVKPDELNHVSAALSRFRSRGGTTALDTGIGWMKTNRAEEMTRLWAHVDLLIGTHDELKFWTALVTPEAIAEHALGLGVQRVVIKMGAKGAAFMSRSESYTHQPAPPINNSNVSVGAGDAFNGALIAKLIEGRSLEVSVNFAQAIAVKIVETGNGVIGWRPGRHG